MSAAAAARTVAEVAPLTAAALADRLGAKKSGAGWVARCPAHDDRNASLSIGEGSDGRILVNCHADCSQEAVVAALGLGFADLMPSRPDRPRRISPASKTTVYRVCDTEGALIAEHVREDSSAGKKVFWRRDGKSGLGGLPAADLPLYGSERADAFDPAKPVFVTEGEKACDALTRAGLHALGTVTGAAGAPTAGPLGVLRGRDVVLWPDFDEPGRGHMQRIGAALRGVASRVRLLTWGEQENDDAADFFARGGSVGGIEKLAAEAPDWQPLKVESLADASGFYRVLDGAIAVKSGDKDPRPLCNFTARITGEEINDDGAERRAVFIIEGELARGGSLPKIRVPAERFGGMSWVSDWGARAIVNAGQANRDHLRAAIQTLSGMPPRDEVFSHTGFRLIGGQWLYLHGGGALGASGADAGIKVSPGGGRLPDFELPAPPEGEALRNAVRASFALEAVAPATAILPVLGAIYRAPLCEFLPVDFALFVEGPTGSQKTELAALAQAHFGARFNARNLPGNWTSTGNSLERAAFQAKDSVFVVDDFAPSGGIAEVQKLHGTAERMFRAQGNRQGRGRMRADGSLAATYFPRGFIVATGEDVPRGHSLRARLLVLELKPGDVRLDQLSIAQRRSADGTFAGAMAGFVRWLAPKAAELPRLLRAQHASLRDSLRGERAFRHDRTPDAMASLLLGTELALQFATETGSLEAAEAERLRRSSRTALLEVGGRQSDFQRTEEPVDHFFDLFWSSLSSGRAYLADAETGAVSARVKRSHLGWREVNGAWQPTGRLVGWVSDEGIYLDPEAAFATAQQYAREANSSLTLTERTLWGRMHDRGMLVVGSEGDRNKPKRTVAGVRRRVLILREPPPMQESGAFGATGAFDEKGQQNGDTSRPTFSDEPGRSGSKTGASDETRPGSRPECPALLNQPGRESREKALQNQYSAPKAPEAPVLEHTPPPGELTEEAPGALARLLNRLATGGFRLEEADGHLRVEPADRITPALSAEIRRHKQAIREAMVDFGGGEGLLQMFATAGNRAAV